MCGGGRSDEVGEEGALPRASRMRIDRVQPQILVCSVQWHSILCRARGDLYTRLGCSFSICISSHHGVRKLSAADEGRQALSALPAVSGRVSQRRTQARSASTTYPPQRRVGGKWAEGLLNVTAGCPAATPLDILASRQPHARSPPRLASSPRKCPAAVAVGAGLSTAVQADADSGKAVPKPLECSRANPRHPPLAPNLCVPA
ncbi:hypothetical protein PSPO01_06738 [Paraphaeosphaeria sporulosa]